MLSDKDLREILEVYNRGYDISRFKDEVYENFVVPKWKAEAIPLIGIEWELQGALLTEECKGKKIYFVRTSELPEDDSFMIYRDPYDKYYDDVCDLRLSKESKWLRRRGEFYIDRVYADVGNLEITSIPVSLDKLDKVFKRVNEFLYGYFSELTKKGLYPFALFIPATDKRKESPVYKHVNVSFVNRRILKILENPTRYSVLYTWKRAEYGEYEDYSTSRLEVKVPYNFKFYKELVLALENSFLIGFYKYLSAGPSRSQKIKDILEVHLRYDVDIVFYVWNRVQRYSHLRSSISDVLKKHYERYGLMEEPELLLYSKTGERLVMPGKLY